MKAKCRAVDSMSQTVDSGFIALSRTLAADLKAATLNHPDILLVVQPGARHHEQYWAERFPTAIQFLFPHRVQAR